MENPPTVLESPISIRAYRPSDRDAVRKIAFDTADMGRSFEPLLDDPELLADFLTRYYTDFEPDSAWVAESNGSVIAYLLGCIDTARYQSIMFWRVLPAATVRAIATGTIFWPQLWRLLSGLITRMILESFSFKQAARHRGAHLHVHIRDGFRGRHIGDKLVSLFESKAQASGVKQICARVREDNARARAFFERLGYRPISSSLPIVYTYGKGESVHFRLITYAKEIPDK
jgi:ribosomal protein S18 acetylase RimI-like enzyme